MPKYKFSAEYEIKASPRILYPYLSTPQGLQEWFAEEVKILDGKDGKIFEIVWDNQSHYAKTVSQRVNQSVRYQFQSETELPRQEQAYLEFRLSYNEFTESTFLTVVDYSDMDNDDSLKQLWAGLVENLRDCVGG
ncbi:START-like domain-containing protein [Hugenholtzia roseola]|uniref:START-like domain-containing protein n=1 Tax=Hugenholtzia roseola TaxID=1002 RepID=UPI0003F6357F|nr:START-like domain-containing protein [Hugenholtzia roseola]